MLEFYSWPRAVIYLIAIVATALFWPVRSIRENLLRWAELNKSISALSIKNAIDSLHTGLMFCEDDGFILLSNVHMQQLMIETTGKIQHNGRKFFELLANGVIYPGCQIIQYEGQNVVIQHGETAWQFSMAKFRIKKKNYIQLTATDVSERWKLTAEQQLQNEEMKLRQDELNETIANLHILCNEKEMQEAKMRTHDILGERLTMLLRTIRSEQTLDYTLLRSLSHGLVDELKAARSTPSPEGDLSSMKQTFESIGVEISIVGNLPEDAAKGKLVVDITKEAVANAVRHGFASQIYVHMESAGGNFHLRIADNGHPPDDTIKEGGGLGGIRRIIEPIGGVLAISLRPGFTLTVDLPEDGGNNV